MENMFIYAEKNQIALVEEYIAKNPKAFETKYNTEIAEAIAVEQLGVPTHDFIDAVDYVFNDLYEEELEEIQDLINAVRYSIEENINEHEDWADFVTDEDISNLKYEFKHRHPELTETTLFTLFSMVGFLE